jgi:hypothetical protein
VQRALASHTAEILQPSREPIALALELLEAEQPRSAEMLLVR